MLLGALGTTVAVSAPNNQSFEISTLPMMQSTSLLTITQVIGKSELQIEIQTVADKYRINAQKFYELAKCESSLDQSLCGDHGTSCGIYQFKEKTWNENCDGLRSNWKAQIECAAKLIADHRNEWINCNKSINWNI